MLFFLTSILSLTAIAADFIHFRRRRRRKLPVRRALVAWVAATDALPILSSLIGALSRDNGPELMHLYMWLFWAWIVTVPPRLAFYAFNFVNLRRTRFRNRLRAAGNWLVLFETGVTARHEERCRLRGMACEEAFTIRERRPLPRVSRGRKEPVLRPVRMLRIRPFRSFSECRTYAFFHRCWPGKCRGRGRSGLRSSSVR